MDFLADLLPFAFLALYFLSRLGRRRPKPTPSAGTSSDTETIDAAASRPGRFSLEDMLERLDQAANPRPAPPPPPPLPVRRTPQTEGPARPRAVSRPDPPPALSSAQTLAQRLRAPEEARAAFVLSTILDRPGRGPARGRRR